MASKRSFESTNPAHRDWDNPPHSRLFVVCPKNAQKEELVEAFEKYGNIEEAWVIKDKASGKSKGIAFIKFAKTSEAFTAMEEMNDQVLPSHTKPIKVLIAQSNKNDGSKPDASKQEKMVRLFIVFPKTLPEQEVRDYFKKFEGIEFMNILKDKATGKTKGCGFIKFRKESQAAKAIEQCDTKFKASFAKPRPSVMTIGDASHLNQQRLARLERAPRSLMGEPRLNQLYEADPRADYYGVRDEKYMVGLDPYATLRAKQQLYEEDDQSLISSGFHAHQSSPSELDHVNKSLGALQSQLANLASITQTLAQTTSLIQAAATGKSGGGSNSERRNPSYAPGSQSLAPVPYGHGKYSSRDSAIDSAKSPYYQYIVREQVRMMMPDSYRDSESGNKRQRFDL